MRLLSLALLNHDPAAGLMGLGCAAIALFALIGIALFVFMIYCWWRIFTRAGYSGALSLLLLIPGLGQIIVVCILAFGDWPINRQR
jgi:uncharacterized membrane protein YhaH (DUF805 family)